MSTTPEITRRARQPYVAIRTAVTMRQLAGLTDRLAEVFAWLGRRGIARSGLPFLRYNVIDTGQLLDVEAGVPVPVTVRGDSRVIAGVLPAGRYATALHVGPYDGLIGAVDSLLQWANARSLEWDKLSAVDGEHWGCRLEIYRTDPSQQPDPARWVTQLAFRLR